MHSWITYHKKIEAVAVVGDAEEVLLSFWVYLALDILHTISKSEHQSYSTITELQEMQYGNQYSPSLMSKKTIRNTATLLNKDSSTYSSVQLPLKNFLTVS